MSLTKQNKSKNKTKNNNNKKRATKKWDAKSSTIKATSPPHLKKKKVGIEVLKLPSHFVLMCSTG